MEKSGDDVRDAVLTSPLDSLICVERKREGKMPERKEATQDMYIVELQRESERTRTILESIKEQIGCLAKENKEILSTLAQMASDERAGRVATDMRIEKLEGGLSAVHARVDNVDGRVIMLEKAPGKRTQTALGWVGKAAASAIVGGILVLLTLGFRAWMGT